MNIESQVVANSYTMKSLAKGRPLNREASPAMINFWERGFTKTPPRKHDLVALAEAAGIFSELDDTKTNTVANIYSQKQPGGRSAFKQNKWTVRQSRPFIFPI
ncbi:MAG: hypothetical protein WA151_07285 [Desulfatirhabdiaceae bacterium]